MISASLLRRFKLRTQCSSLYEALLPFLAWFRVVCAESCLFFCIIIGGGVGGEEK